MIATETSMPRRTRHGQLVADWVELFAPVVFEPHRSSAWPEAGSLLLDDLPFSVRDPATGRFRIAFRVPCVAGFEDRRPQLYEAEVKELFRSSRWGTIAGSQVNEGMVVRSARVRDPGVAPGEWSIGVAMGYSKDHSARN